MRTTTIPTLLMAAAAVLVLAACGSIMHGTTQQVSISSTPSSASVTIDGMQQGTTPLVADLKRKDTHTIRIDADGYQPWEMAVSRSVSGWVAGNIVFGGIIGLAVDAITGGMYKLTPEQVEAGLARADIEELDEALYVAVVLVPDAEWELIGQLEGVR